MRKELEATPTTLEDAVKLLDIAKTEIKENETKLKDTNDKLTQAEKDRDVAREASRKNFDAFVNSCNEVRSIKRDPMESKDNSIHKVADIHITPKY